MLLLITLVFLWDLSWGLPNGAVIQDGGTAMVKYTGAIKVVLVNGVPVGLLCSGVYNMNVIARSIDALITQKNNNSFPNNLIYVPLRECNLKGQRVVLLSDRIGKDILAFCPLNDTRAARVLQGGTLGQIWNHDTAHAVLKELQLEVECAKLLEKLDRLENSEGMNMIPVMALLLAAVVVVALILLSFSMFKKHAGHVGGVLGSIIHYPAHSLGRRNNQGQKTSSVQRSLLTV